MAGRCHEGVDCKFSHPAAADELEPVLISELLPHQYHGSSMLPASPLQLMPVPFFMQAPPRRHPRRNVPRGQDGNVARTRRKEEVALNGATLRPIEPSQSVHVEADSSMEAPMSPVQSARPSELLEARMIERPLSTPPATSAVAKLIRVSNVVSTLLWIRMDLQTEHRFFLQSRLNRTYSLACPLCCGHFFRFCSCFAFYPHPITLFHNSLYRY